MILWYQGLERVVILTPIVPIFTNSDFIIEPLWLLESLSNHKWLYRDGYR